jgi:hypothetical protein
MLLAVQQNTHLTRPEGERGTRFARGVLVAGIAAFSALAALVPTKRGEAMDRMITTRVQANGTRASSRDGPCLLVRLSAAEPHIAPHLRRCTLDCALPARGGIPAASGTGLLSTIVKSFMRRPRPVAGTDLRVVAAPLRGSSLPSGHVLTYVGVYGWMAIMANLLIRPPWLRRIRRGGIDDPHRRGWRESDLSGTPLAE